MKIGILGAGHIGGTLTRRLTALGHQVSVANSRGPETLADLAAETGAKPVSVGEAAQSGEVVIVTISEKNIAELPHDLFAATPDNVVIVDTATITRRTAMAASMRSSPVWRRVDGLGSSEPVCGQGFQQYLCPTPDEVGTSQRHTWAETSMQMAFDARCPRQAKSESHSGEQPKQPTKPWEAFFLLKSSSLGVISTSRALPSFC